MLSGAFPTPVPTGSTRTLHLPFTVAGLRRLYASEHHARTSAGSSARQPDPLLPNWRHPPVSYTGRAGSVVVFGTDVVRPCGRVGARRAGTHLRVALRPTSRPSWASWWASAHPMWAADRGGRCRGAPFGVVLFNDWSARDIQAQSTSTGPAPANLRLDDLKRGSPAGRTDAAPADNSPQDPAVLLPPGVCRRRPWLDIDLEVELTHGGQPAVRLDVLVVRPDAGLHSPSTARRPAPVTCSPPAPASGPAATRSGPHRARQASRRRR